MPVSPSYIHDVTVSEINRALHILAARISPEKQNTSFIVQQGGGYSPGGGTSGGGGGGSITLTMPATFNVSGSPGTTIGVTWIQQTEKTFLAGPVSGGGTPVFRTIASTDLTSATGNLTETGSSILTITGGDNAVVGTGTTVKVQKADATHDGYLSAADWATFNSKVGGVMSYLVGGWGDNWGMFWGGIRLTFRP
jgi:hypothetical protein